MAVGSRRQSLCSAYVLHHYPYQDSSTLLEVFSREYGRVGLVARGLRGKRGQRQALLQPFVPILVSWSGRGELLTLTDVEPERPVDALQGIALLSAFYLNELLLRLLKREDAYPYLFDCYDQSLFYLRSLSRDHNDQIQIVLRLFEKVLLEELGYGLVLSCDVQGEALEPDAIYEYIPGQGPQRVGANRRSAMVVQGKSLLALDKGELDLQVARDIKLLMRTLIDQQLGGKPLRSRKMLMEMLQVVDSRQ